MALSKSKLSVSLALAAVAAGAWMVLGRGNDRPAQAGATSIEAPGPQAAVAKPELALAAPPARERAVPPTEATPTFEGDEAAYDAAAAAFDPAKDRFFKPSARTLPDCFRMLVDPRVNPGRKMPTGKEARDFCAIQERLQAEMMPLYWRYNDLVEQSLAERFKSGEVLDETEAKAALKVPGAIVNRRDGYGQGNEDPGSLTMGGTAWAALMPGQVPELDNLRDQIAALKERAALDMRRSLSGQ